MNRADDVFEALADRSRRRVLVALLRREARDALPLPDPVAAADAESRAAAIRMHHVHLPRLEAGGFVERDEATGAVTPGPAFPVLRAVLVPLLESEASMPDGWL